jgi:hypothetical protein
MPMFADVQNEFAKALLDPDRPVPSAVTSHTSGLPERRFGVYRNNVVASLVNALRTRFTVVERIVGEEFFAAMARLFVIASPPRSPVLHLYGDGLPDFIEAFAPAADLIYLADVARLEAARTRAFHAADAPPADPREWARLDPALLIRCRFALHPSMQIVCSNHPIVTIWAMNSGEAELRPIDDDGPEDALVVRPRHDVLMHRLPPGGAKFLRALAAGCSLGDAAASAGADFKLDVNFAGALNAGLLTEVLLSRSDRSQQR